MNNPGTSGQCSGHGNIFEIAKLLFTRYIFAFEVTSALLITAALGAMVLAHRERHEPKRSQLEQMRDRFKVGTHPTPLPGPGVYARHNAVDTPALLPDGTVRPQRAAGDRGVADRARAQPAAGRTGLLAPARSRKGP